MSTHSSYNIWRWLQISAVGVYCRHPTLSQYPIPHAVYSCKLCCLQLLEAAAVDSRRVRGGGSGHAGGRAGGAAVGGPRAARRRAAAVRARRRRRQWIRMRLHRPVRNKPTLIKDNSLFDVIKPHTSQT